MTSKVLLNNVKLFKKRDASVDNQLQQRFQAKNDKVKMGYLQESNKGGAVLLPKINQRNFLGNQVKYLKSNNCRSIERAADHKQQKQHSRMGSIDHTSSGQCSTKHSSTQLSTISLSFANLNTNFAKKFDLVSDYGKKIDSYLKELETKSQLSQGHLEGHKVNGVQRAKMVDWMVEVLTAFKCSDQTFFIAINLLDRYFDSLGKQKVAVELHELHIIGVVCMFMASKYEDVYPLLMKTVFNKIGHQKISQESIRQKEMDILRAIDFKIGGFPTILEFMQSYTEKILKDHEDKEFICLMSVYLAKMALHHVNLCTKQSSLLAASCIYVALKICEQMRQKTILNKSILRSLLDVSDIEEKKLIECSKKVLYLAQNFEKELPGLSNIKECYIPQLNKFVSQQ